MTEYHFLQNYWWFIISLLGATLVFMLFVQGGQSMLLSARTPNTKSIILKAMGRKWELTFTTLVVFGGAFFASFPMFYSTSFGGAYWLWILILFSFIVQAVSYEYRAKPGNVYGASTYDAFLFINGCVGCVLLGVAVAMMFFGGEFTVVRSNMLDASSPVISTWAPTHGFEAIFNWKNLLLGVAVLFLARTMACLYMINYVSSDANFIMRLRKQTFINAGIFLIFFLAFLAVLLTCTGYNAISQTNGTLEITKVPYKYLHSYVQFWPTAGLALLIGVIGVIYGIFRTIFSSTWRKGVWYAGIGAVLVVLSLFWVAGYGPTPFYPSLIDPMSSLTIRNASASQFTLSVMAYVSLIVPIVVAYIWYVWRQMDKKVTD